MIDRYTYQELIRKYAEDVETGYADRDITDRCRRIVTAMLRRVAATGDTAVYYPPTDATRDDACRRAADLLWDARPYMWAVSGDDSAEDIDAAHTRTLAILRGI